MSRSTYKKKHKKTGKPLSEKNIFALIFWLVKSGKEQLGLQLMEASGVDVDRVWGSGASASRVPSDPSAWIQGSREFLLPENAKVHLGKWKTEGRIGSQEHHKHFWERVSLLSPTIPF